MNERVYLVIVLRSLFAPNDGLIKDAVGAVEIHNCTLILFEEYDDGQSQKKQNRIEEASTLSVVSLELLPSVRQPCLQRRRVCQKV